MKQFDYAWRVSLYNDSPAKPSGRHGPDLSTQKPFPDWLVPEWPAPLNVKSVCTTRSGGVSDAPFSALNLGAHVGDTPPNVEANRQHLAAWLSNRGPEAVRPVFMEQVHGTHVTELDGKTPDGIQADGAVTASTHLACTVMVADCLPVLLCNAQGSQVAAVHAGWRGLAGQGGRGVLEVALTALTASGPTYATDAGECLAWLGPCIGPQAFEVGDDVRAAFVEVNPGATTCFAPLPSGKWLADLPALARQRLQTLGVTQIFGNDGSAPWCTVNNPSRFFSYRRDGVTGRIAACIWRDG